jgi:hypothetical protein
MRYFNYLITFFLCILSFSVFAEQCTTITKTYYWYVSTSSNGWVSDINEGCENVASARSGDRQSFTYAGSYNYVSEANNYINYSCNLIRDDGTELAYQLVRVYSEESDSECPTCPTGLKRITYTYFYTKEHEYDNFSPCDVSIDGCGYTICGAGTIDGFDELSEPEDGYPECHKTEGGGENDVTCTVTDVANGTGSSVSDETTIIGAEEGGYSDLGLEDEKVTDTTVSNSQTTVTGPTTETLPDGSTVTTKTEQTTQTVGDGVKVTEDTTTVSTTNTDGITKTTTTTTTTTNNPDGTSSETVRSNTTYTNAPQTTCQSGLNLNGERYLNCSATAGSQNGSTTTTTTTKDADGNVTGQTSSTESECQTTEGVDPNCNGNSQTCDPTKDANACKTEDEGDPWAPSGEEAGTFDIDSIEADITSAKSDLSNTLSTIKAEAADLVSVDLSGSANLPSLDFDLGSFGSFPIDLSSYDSEFSPIRFALLFAATVSAVFILLGPGRRS